MTVELHVDLWAAQQFESCNLGDARRNGRAMKMAAQFAANPRQEYSRANGNLG
jgi:hypothetical protein